MKLEKVITLSMEYNKDPFMFITNWHFKDLHQSIVYNLGSSVMKHEYCYRKTVFVSNTRVGHAYPMYFLSLTSYQHVVSYQHYCFCTHYIIQHQQQNIRLTTLNTNFEVHVWVLTKSNINGLCKVLTILRASFPINRYKIFNITVSVYTWIYIPDK